MAAYAISAPPGVRYQPFWCEENIWQLTSDPVVGEGERVAMVIGGSGGVSGYVACWNQRAADRPEAMIQWDYHVVLLVRRADTCVVWDLDTYLGCPLPLTAWIRGTFPHQDRVPARLQPRFLLIPANEWRHDLGSDRGHMLTPTGAWLRPPPPWEMPRGATSLTTYVQRARTTGCTLTALECTAFTH